MGPIRKQDWDGRGACLMDYCLNNKMNNKLNNTFFFQWGN